MALVKSVPLTIDPRASKLADIKERVEQAQTMVSESKVKLDFYKKEYEKLKVQAAEMGVSDTKLLQSIIDQHEQELDTLLVKLEENLSKAEQILNGN